MFIHEGLTLRVVERDDLDLIRALRNDPTTWINLTDVRLIMAPQQLKWFDKMADAIDRKYFVVADEQFPFVGLVRCDEIDHLNRSIRVGCDIVPQLRGKHYGSRVFDATLRYCFDFLNMHRVWLLVMDNNARAIGLYRNKGFQEEGRLRESLYRDGRYHDYISMSILEQEYRQRMFGEGYE